MPVHELLGGHPQQRRGFREILAVVVHRHGDLAGVRHVLCVHLRRREHLGERGGRRAQRIEPHEHRAGAGDALDDAGHAVPGKVQPHGFVEALRLDEQSAVGCCEDAHQTMYSASGTSVMNM